MLPFLKNRAGIWLGFFADFPHEQKVGRTACLLYRIVTGNTLKVYSVNIYLKLDENRVIIIGSKRVKRSGQHDRRKNL